MKTLSLAELRAEIDREAKGRPVQLLAVSKGQPISAIEELYQAGQRDFGENYVQELAEKAEQLVFKCPGIRWHFIGHLQSNKVKVLVPWLGMVHSVHSADIALELSKRWGQMGRNWNLPILLEVNIDMESSKRGIDPKEVQELVERISEIPGLDLRGLMCIPAAVRAENGEAFRALRVLEEKCQPFTQGELSMGMSNDFLVAVREGATWVRIGTLLFGLRKKMC